MKRKFELSDVMQVDASIDQVRSFITNPQRIADYYPGIQEFGTFIEGQAIWCRDKSGVTLLEYPQDQKTDSKIVMHVTTSLSAKPPFTIESIKADKFLTLSEDWLLEEKHGGTEITKVWRDVELHKMKWLPIGFVIKRTAKKEHSTLIDGWNKAAKELS